MIARLGGNLGWLAIVHVNITFHFGVNIQRTTFYVGTFIIRETPSLAALLYFSNCPIRIEFGFVEFKGTGSRLSACSLLNSRIKLRFSNLLLILSINNPTHTYLSDLRVYFKVT